MPTIGTLIHHIFSAECRYVDRLRQRPVRDTSAIATSDLAALFELGSTGRREFEALLTAMVPEAWDTPVDFPLLNATFQTTPRKVILHAVTHEIRHWAQVGTLLRLSGLTAGIQDLIFSPVLGETTRL